MQRFFHDECVNLTRVNAAIYCLKYVCLYSFKLFENLSCHWFFSSVLYYKIQVKIKP